LTPLIEVHGRHAAILTEEDSSVLRSLIVYNCQRDTSKINDATRRAAPRRSRRSAYVGVNTAACSGWFLCQHFYCRSQPLLAGEAGIERVAAECGYDMRPFVQLPERLMLTRRRQYIRPNNGVGLVCSQCRIRPRLISARK